MTVTVRVAPLRTDSVNVLDSVNASENVIDSVNVFENALDSVNVCVGGRHSSSVPMFMYKLPNVEPS